MLFQLHEWDIHALCFGTGGAKVTEVCSRVRVLPYQDALGAPVFRDGPAIRWARAWRMRRWIVNVIPLAPGLSAVRGQPLALAVCCLTADSRAGRESQPSCDQMILPEAETRANQGWSWTW